MVLVNLILSMYVWSPSSDLILRVVISRGVKGRLDSSPSSSLWSKWFYVTYYMYIPIEKFHNIMHVVLLQYFSM